MPESQEEQEKRRLRELEGKNVAYYSILLSSWIQTKMELDKTLLTLASGGIAFLVTILTTVGAKTWWEVLLFIGAFLGFGICIWSSLIIYQRNSRLIEHELNIEDSCELKLKKYDKLSLWSFILGVIFLCLIGVVAAGGKIISTEVSDMAEGKERKLLPKEETVEKSLDGLPKLRPEAVQNQGQSHSSQQEGSSVDSSQGADSSQSSSDSDNKKD